MSKEYDKTDQSIRSEGAEAYVRAILMMEFGIIISMASRNMPGHDLVAHNLENGRSCKISVKFRRAIDANGFHNVGEKFDYDYVVCILGKRGKIGDRVLNINPKEGFKAEAYVFPKCFAVSNCKVLKKYDLLPNPSKKKTPKSFLEYKGAWHLIADNLGYSVERVMQLEKES